MTSRLLPTMIVQSLGVLIVIGLSAASARCDDKITVKNATGKDVAYKYRAIYNDGNGSHQKYFTVSQKVGATSELKAAGVPDYGIVIRLLGDGTNGRKLYARNGPFEIRLGKNPFTGAETFDVYDVKGNAIPAVFIGD